VGGGANNVVTFQDFYEYNPATDSWTQRPNYGGGTIIQPFYFTIGNRGYVGSGSSGFYPNINLISEFWEWGPEGKPNGIIGSENNYSGEIAVRMHNNSLAVNFSQESRANTILKLFDISGRQIAVYNIPGGIKSAEYFLRAKGTLLYQFEINNSKVKSGKIVLL